MGNTRYLLYVDHIVLTARQTILREMASGWILCTDLALRCAWLATPEGFQHHPIEITRPHFRQLIKKGLITPRGEQNSTSRLFVISAKGQAELRKGIHRVARSPTKFSAPTKGATSESKNKTNPRAGSPGFGDPHWGRDSLLRTLQAAQNKNKTCVTAEEN
jgi:hypothetical protein